MMREYLVFHLYGPLASWGDIAVGETRPSALTPTKSAVLGLIAAALGLKRPDTVATEEERADWESCHAALARGYGLAVSVQALGVPLSDYHTVEVPKGIEYSTRRDEILEVQRQKKSGVSFKGTILSRREYRQDAFAACALWSRSNAPYALSELRDALREPRFVLYLGRKSCPLALPLKPELVSAEIVEMALAGVGLAQILSLLWDETTAKRLSDKFGQEQCLLLWDSDAETRIPIEQIITRRDAPLSRRRWQFSVREEHRAHWPEGGAP